ncbi:hypothetical protein Fmac_028858 [Flemingia macrophylla]|uniref:AMP-binding enzyme C-terminal domain-containing protein n=1 Tax=Flemingia macrophylla TaxID=520843 RepID=A0ABD1L8Q4_9FABA
MITTRTQLLFFQEQEKGTEIPRKRRLPELGQKPGSATFPFFGVQSVIVNEKSVEIEGDVVDICVLRNHGLGHTEHQMESALVSHPQCAEVAVVGVEHEVKGQGIYAFVIALDGVPYSEHLQKDLVPSVQKQLDELGDTSTLPARKGTVSDPTSGWTSQKGLPTEVLTGEGF